MLKPNKFVHVAIAVVLCAVPSIAFAQSTPLVVEERGLAPLLDGVLPPACAAAVNARKNPTNPYRAKVTGGYSASLCEAEAAARENLVTAISRILAQSTGVAISADQKEALESFVATARVTERKIWVDRQLAEVVVQVSLNPKSFKASGR
jgi:hypothetical protein